ncbi:MAG TPA: EscU/YscU/HrcU family type III secretion system export apparatus switch protein [Burkholderiaceae bacterium]|nr:EscU/YscU/HrcU family type III secretion system export apparatus switch protein [Burkholderiaceae bacterium]
MSTNESDNRPRQQAVALSYTENDHAPKVVAKGYGTIAEQIIQMANESGLYVHQSPELIGVLMQLDLDEEIPTELYQAVAELLAWLYRLETED